MKGVMFQDWLSVYDKGMRAKRRKIVLILDKATAPTIRHETAERDGCVSSSQYDTGAAATGRRGHPVI